MSFRVQLEVFEGPLDLLLHLIKKNEVAITDVSLGAITEQFFGRDLYAFDVALYIEPPYRGSGFAAARMIREFEKWAAGNGVAEIHLGVSTGVNTARTAEFYKRLGYASEVISLRKRIPDPPKKCGAA